MDISERTLQLKTDIDEVYEAGKKAEHNEFWNNTDVDGQYAFNGTAWNRNNFKPNRDIPVTIGTFFRHSWQNDAYDLAKQLEDLGIKLIFTSGSDYQTFRYSWFTRLPACDFSVCEGAFDTVFHGMARLVTIDKIIFPEEGKITAFTNPFVNCSRLANINEVKGVIDKSISFSECPLSVASMKNIISCLKDFSGTDGEYSCTLTLKSSAFSALEAEGATAEYNGEACTWAELIDNKKWNLTLAS